MRVIVMLLDKSINRCLEHHEFIELKYAFAWAESLKKRHSDNPYVEVIVDDPYQRPDVEYQEAEAWSHD